MFSIFSYPGNIWILDFSYFLIILKTFFNGGPGGRGQGSGAGGMSLTFIITQSLLIGRMDERQSGRKAGRPRV